MYLLVDLEFLVLSTCSTVQEFCCSHPFAENIPWILICRYVFPLFWISACLYLPDSVGYTWLKYATSAPNQPENIQILRPESGTLMGISKTLAILEANPSGYLTPMTAPISSKREILVAMLGATRVFAATTLLENEPSS